MARREVDHSLVEGSRTSSTTNKNKSFSRTAPSAPLRSARVSPAPAATTTNDTTADTVSLRQRMPRRGSMSTSVVRQRVSNDEEATPAAPPVRRRANRRASVSNMASLQPSPYLRPCLKRRKSSDISMPQKKCVRFIEDAGGSPMGAMHSYEMPEVDEDEIWWSYDEISRNKLDRMELARMFAEDAKCVLIVDVLFKTSDHGLLIKASKRLHREYPDVRGLESLIATKASQYSFQNRVDVLDTNDEIYRKGSQTTDEAWEMLKKASLTSSKWSRRFSANLAILTMK